MNRKNSILMVVLFLFIAAVLFVGLSGKSGGLFRKKAQAPVEQAAAPSEHQGHGTALFRRKQRILLLRGRKAAQLFRKKRRPSRFPRQASGSSG